MAWCDGVSASFRVNWTVGGERACGCGCGCVSVPSAKGLVGGGRVADFGEGEGLDGREEGHVVGGGATLLI